MKKKTLSAGIMAALVVTTMTGCSEPAQVNAVNTVQECSLETGDVFGCVKQWEHAQRIHEEAAPRFDGLQSCSESFGDQCTERTVTNENGTTSSVFIPMMAGMMVGQMMNGSTGNNVRYSQPLYQEKERRANGAYVNTSSMTTSTGATVAKGASTVRAKSLTHFTKASSTPISRGGFGGAARGGSGS